MKADMGGTARLLGIWRAIVVTRHRTIRVHHLAYFYHWEFTTPMRPQNVKIFISKFAYEIISLLLRTRVHDYMCTFVHGPNLDRVPFRKSKVSICQARRLIQITQDHLRLHLHLQSHKHNACLTTRGVLTCPLRDKRLSNSTHVQDAAKWEIMFLHLGWPKGCKNCILLRRTSHLSLYLGGVTW